MAVSLNILKKSPSPDYFKDKEKRKIVDSYRDILRSGSNFLNKSDQKIIRKAFDIALAAYADRRLPSGEPLILQQLDVCSIITGLIGLGPRSIAAGLLYEAVKEHYLTKKAVKQNFEPKVLNIIEELLKLEQVKVQKDTHQQDYYQKMLLSMVGDVRVILVRLALLLEEMRSLNYESQANQLRLSMEAFTIYAPLAHRMGLYNVKMELENLAFKYTENETYKELIKKLQDTTEERNKYINRFCDPIKKELTKQGFRFEIKGRPKSVYSIWQKMKKQNVSFEEVYDLFAIRIILNSKPKNEKADCWRVYSIVTDFYQPNPKRLRDWISVPKSNGYESLHTTVVGPDKKWVEVQIRTSRMDEIAEKGYAAHWRYKGIQGEKGIDNWMNRIRELLENPDISPVDKIDNLQLNLYTKEIFAFTPNGDLKKLPAGASVLDFAYDIHTDIGDRCVGAKINKKNVTIKQKLQNGDTVEIITSKTQSPKRDWLNFVVTSKAKSKIKHSLKEEQLKESEIGRELLIRRLKNWKIEFSEALVSKITKHYKLKNPVDFYYQLAVEKIDIADVKELLTKKKGLLEEEPEKVKEQEEREAAADQQKETAAEKEKAPEDYLTIDEKLENVDYKLAKCCNPIYGDDIFGFVTINDGIKIHRVNCPNARQMLSRYNYRVVEARWSKSAGAASFQTSIKVSGIDEVGMLNKISDIISNEMKVSMRGLQIDSNDGMFEGHIKLYVESTKHLDILIRKLKKEKGILKVVRMEGNVKNNKD